MVNTKLILNYGMNHKGFKSWLEAYRATWETRDPHGAGELFTDDATYYETPFQEPIKGRSRIIEYWSDATQSQEGIRFGYEILAVTENIGIARWWVSYARIPSKKLVRLNGIFVVALNEETRCTEFREWWHSEATPKLH